MALYGNKVFLRKVFCFVLCLMLLPLLNSNGETQIKAAGERDQLIDVLLTRLNISERMDVSLDEDYYLVTADGTELLFRAGSNLNMILNERNILVFYEGMGINAGSHLTLNRTEKIEKKGFRLTNYQTAYLGNLYLDISEGCLRPILKIHVEDYLLGVVPYEMSDSFPLEALKAQAVAARTYALRNQNQYDDYDVVDNTNDQVFKGYTTGNTRAEQAVAETRGVCGFYQGKLAQCFYAASNGGQMERVETVWPKKGAFPYYAFGEDPYDLENPESLVRSIELKKTYSSPENAPYAFRKLLAATMASELERMGGAVGPDDLRIDRIYDVSVRGNRASESKWMSTLYLEMELSVKKENGVLISDVDQDEDVSLFDRAGTSNGQADEYIPLEEKITLEIPIFPEAEDALGMDLLSNYDNEIWSVVDNGNSFVIEARRYGHGVGMSQRGAQWMASQYEKTYQEILTFYYPGMQLKQYAEPAVKATTFDASLLIAPGQAPTPTPRPTLMPVTQHISDGQWYALVTEIADDSSLNLRSEPSMNGTILMRLYKGQKLLVLERCAEEGWVHVRTDVTEGYVMESFLSKEGKQ